MKPNIENIKKLITDKFNGNKSAFSKAIGVDRTQVSKVLNTGTGAGAQFFGGLMSYCKAEDLDFYSYIFLPDSVNKINNNSRSTA